MEDIRSVIVKTKTDNGTVYPSERRYSASTVSGLAWVHIALACTSLLLACLALVNPNRLAKVTDVETPAIDNRTDILTGNSDYSFILAVAPSLVSVFALGAGLSAILASVRWYVDRNIAILFLMSVLSTLFSLLSFVMVATWYTTSGNMSDVRDKTLFRDYIVVKHDDVLERNESHFIISMKQDNVQPVFNKSVLSINILIAAFLELIWSCLSLKISYKGMRTEYKDEVEPKRDNGSVTIITKIKRNQARPDFVNYPRIMERNISNDRSYLKYLTDRDEIQNTHSDYYSSRMTGFLGRYEEETGLDSDPSWSKHLNTIREGYVSELEEIPRASWGDTPDHTVYNQDTINFEAIFKMCDKKSHVTEECNENE